MRIINEKDRHGVIAKIMDSGSTDRDRLEDARTNPVRSRMLAEEHDEPVRFRQRTESTEEAE